MVWPKENLIEKKEQSSDGVWKEVFHLFTVVVAMEERRSFYQKRNPVGGENPTCS